MAEFPQDHKKDGFANDSESEMDKWIAKVKEILVNPDVNALDLLDMIHNDLIKTDIMVFTPKGEQRSIEKGAQHLISHIPSILRSETKPLLPR